MAGNRDASETAVTELVDGRLSLTPQPRLEHALVVEGFSEELGPPFRRGRGGPGGWVIVPGPELHLGPIPDVVVPDLAGWRRERLPPDFVANAPATLAPDWCCEVLSPSTEKNDRGPKMGVYHRAGVGHVWLASPALQMLEVYRWHDLGWLRLAAFTDDAAVRAEPFDAVLLDLAGLWTL